MKRVMLVLLLMASLVGLGIAEDEYVNYQTYDNDGFKMYYLPKAGVPVVVAKYNVTVDSITLILASDATYYMQYRLTNADISTFALFKASMAAVVDIDTRTHAGQWIVTIPEDVSPSTLMTALNEVVISSNCWGRSNEKQLTVDTSSTTIMAFLPTARAGRTIKVKYAIANVTGTSPTITIYNQSGTALTPSASMTSGSALYFGVEDTNHPIAMGVNGETISVRVVTTAAMTAGYLLVGYTVE